MSDHSHYGEYAEARHDHEGDYAPGRHEHGYYDLSGVAEEHHRHYDLERELATVRRDLDHVIADLRDAIDRVQALEAQTPDARQAELEADLAASGFGGGDDFTADRHADLDAGESGGAMTDAGFYDRTAGEELSPVTCMRTIWADGRPGQCGEPVDHEPTAECPGNPHARPAPEAGQP